MASRSKPADGPGAPEERADAGAAAQQPAPGGAAAAPVPPADTSAERSDRSGGLVENNEGDRIIDSGPPETGTAAATDAGVPLDPRGLSDPATEIRALAAAGAHAARERRYREIPAEGIAIEARYLNALAVHLDLDPGTVIAARQYPDRFVYVTRDGRKVEKDLG